ncbi:hypothetical protein GRF29_19g2469142 [Pseudopithomyces chartarum]|uniref:Uncharacterized protein n=1 Tax=Pseudopithomyces chartarum TaxID=1892770 RepID=A0AAN6M6T7_9PLEO|nr:hypothetical protein GRF29_19g2469142 [Pseudopithomyces chartarum]
MLRHIFLLATGILPLVMSQWIDYDRPSIYSKSSQYTIKVNGTYAQTVTSDNYDYVQLSMAEGYPTEFRIATYSGAKITGTPIVSPQATGVKYRVEGKELIFSLKKIHYLIVKLNNLKELVIMIDRHEKDAPPSKGVGIMNVLNHGADNTGKAVTDGIQKTLDAAGKKPGTIVYVPPGVYLIGNLIIPSQTSLYLAGGSVLRMTGNKSDYKVYFTKSVIGDGTWWIRTAYDSKDIKIFGRGTIDGNAKATIQSKLVAHLVMPIATTNFQMDGVLVRDGSYWTVTPTQVTGAKLTNIKILNNINGKQNDGIDVVESTNVKVWRAIAIGNDDSFSTKTWPDGADTPYPYKHRGLSDVSFDSCVAWTRCYGYKVGQGVTGDQENVVFKNSVVYYGGVGLGIHHKFGNGTVRNVTFVNMDLERLQGEPGGTGTWLALFVQDVKRGHGPIQDVTVKDVHARSLGKYHGKITGLNDKSNVDGVTISDIYILGNKTAAKTLKELDIQSTEFSKNIHIKNSK